MAHRLWFADTFFRVCRVANTIEENDFLIFCPLDVYIFVSVKIFF